ncbi:peroxisome assembly protein 26-like [Lytechinus pictus]|uniref:peroxisome assembly protein 26-like n=1 Tax=Lytechinus pictus TaxID=7653 RepID=UPI0030B9F417
MDIGMAREGHQVDGVKILQAANDLLLFRRHEEVLRVCRLGVDRNQEVVFPRIGEQVSTRGDGTDFQNGLSDENEQNLKKMHKDAMREYLESMCILAMQAYAELDKWDQALPFLMSCYGDISKLPPRIVLMCILLFSKVRNFGEAELFSSQWLKTQNGWSINQYCSVLETYIKRVYISQGQWKDAREYIETNTVLSPERKMRYLKYLAELQQQKESSSTNGCKNAKHSQPGNILLSLFQKLRSFFVSRLSPSTSHGLHRIQNLALISVFLYLLLFRTNTSIPTGASQANAVWSSLVGVWRSLFAPFHVMVQEAQ